MLIKNKKDSFLLKKETWERKMKNKKGAEKLLSLWWFLVLAVIGGGIVIGVLIYYNADVNIKEVEADILAERIVSCLVDNGYLNEKVLDNNFDVFKECKLSENIFGKGSNFYFNISIYNEAGLLRDEILAGDGSLVKDCEIEEKITAKHFPRCSEKSENVLYFYNREIKKANLKVLAGSNQLGKKVQVV